MDWDNVEGKADPAGVSFDSVVSVCFGINVDWVIGRDVYRFGSRTVLWNYYDDGFLCQYEKGAQVGTDTGLCGGFWGHWADTDCGLGGYSCADPFQGLFQVGTFSSLLPHPEGREGGSFETARCDLIIDHLFKEIYMY